MFSKRGLYRYLLICVPGVCLGVWLAAAAPGSWATQEQPPADDPMVSEQVAAPPQEESAVPPMEEIVISYDDEPLIDPSYEMEEVMADPAPEGDWELNDQGGYDKKLDYFCVYFGSIGYDPWTHHGLYKQLARAWYAVLGTIPTVQAWFADRPLEALEIRYWYDPIPGPMAYSAHAIAHTEDGVAFAEIFGLNGAELDFRLAELEGYFGRAVALSPCRFWTP